MTNKKYTESSYIIDNFSAGNFCSDKYRKELEDKYKDILIVTEKFNRQSVSYQLSKSDVLHRWLKYKEGFSANLINTLLDEMGVHPGQLIMDPFMGSGTTALVCQMRNLDCIGYDILPLSSISINAKSDVLNYDIGEIQSLIRDVQNLQMPESFADCTPSISITQHAYPEYNKRFLAYISLWRDQSNYSPLVKNLLTLCILNSLEISSYTVKSGQYLGWDCRSTKVMLANKKRVEDGKKPYAVKYVRPEIANVKEQILSELEHVLNDIIHIQTSNKIKVSSRIDFIENSVLYELPKLPENYISGVVTSPPYCNRYDYTRTYALELAYLGVNDDALKMMRQSLLSCTVENKPKIDHLRKYYESIGESERFEYIYGIIHSHPVFREIMESLLIRKENGDLNNNGIIRMVEGYFTELAFVYAELYRISKPGSHVVFVNDNVRYGGEVIPVDFLSTSFAEAFGFKAKCIYALKQQKGNSSQQMAKYGRVPLRKSITVWEKT